jgi:hypothetical protein
MAEVPTPNDRPRSFFTARFWRVFLLENFQLEHFEPEREDRASLKALLGALDASETDFTQDRVTCGAGVGECLSRARGAAVDAFNWSALSLAAWGIIRFAISGSSDAWAAAVLHKARVVSVSLRNSATACLRQCEYQCQNWTFTEVASSTLTRFGLTLPL